MEPKVTTCTTEPTSSTLGPRLPVLKWNTPTAGYYEKVLMFSERGESPVVLTVGDYASKDVSCQQLVAGDTNTGIPFTALDDSELVNYKNPNR